MATDRHVSGTRAFAVAGTRAALLIIDMQRAFVEEGAAYEIPAIRPRIPNIERLLEFARAHALPVVWTRSDHTPPYGGAVLRKCPAVRADRICWRGEESSELYRDMSQPTEHDYEIVKHKYDAFFETDLDAILRNTGVETVIITGVTTAVCCDSTARSAFSRDYNVVLVSDATAEVDPQLHHLTLQVIDMVFGRVMGTRELLAELSEEPPDRPARLRG